MYIEIWDVLTPASLVDHIYLHRNLENPFFLSFIYIYFESPQYNHGNLKISTNYDYSKITVLASWDETLVHKYYRTRAIIGRRHNSKIMLCTSNINLKFWIWGYVLLNKFDPAKSDTFWKYFPLEQQGSKYLIWKSWYGSNWFLLSKKPSSTFMASYVRSQLPYLYNFYVIASHLKCSALYSRGTICRFMQKWHSTVYNWYQVMGMFERKKDWISQYPRYRQDGTEIMHTYILCVSIS